MDRDALLHFLQPVEDDVDLLRLPLLTREQCGHNCKDLVAVHGDELCADREWQIPLPLGGISVLFVSERENEINKFHGIRPRIRALALCASQYHAHRLYCTSQGIQHQAECLESDGAQQGFVFGIPEDNGRGGAPTLNFKSAFAYASSEGGTVARSLALAPVSTGAQSNGPGEVLKI